MIRILLERVGLWILGLAGWKVRRVPKGQYERILLDEGERYAISPMTSVRVFDRTKPIE